MTNPLDPLDKLAEQLEKVEQFALKQSDVQHEINLQILSELRSMWKQIQQLSENKTPNTKPFGWRE